MKVICRTVHINSNSRKGSERFTVNRYEIDDPENIQ